MADDQEWNSIASNFDDVLDLTRLSVIAIRLIVAAILGGILGIQRESVGKAAGIRTHMLVSVGSAFLIIIPQLEGMSIADLSRVLQGVITGIGFVSAGVILKLPETERIRGLTTAAGIWLTSAVGVAVGFGRLGSAAVATLLAFIILSVVYRLSRIIGDDQDEDRA